MEIIREVRPAKDLWWEEGSILDTENEKPYSLRVRIADDNRSLMLRSYIGPFSELRFGIVFSDTDLRL